MTVPPLRSFIQRDDKQVQEYLEAIEGGAPEGAFKRTDDTRRARGGSVGVRAAPLEASLGAQGQDTHTDEVRIIRTPPANFQLLHQYMEDGGHIERLEGADAAEIEALAVGQLVEIFVTGRLSRKDQDFLRFQKSTAVVNEGLHRAEQYLDQVQPMVELAEVLGIDLGAKDPNFDKNVQLLQKMRARTPVVPSMEGPRRVSVIATLVGLSKPNFVVPVRTDTLMDMVPVEDLEGEYFVFGKVSRRIARGSSLDPAEFSSLPSSVNRAERRKARGGVGETVSGPASVIEPIAIYR